jgi:hydrogenase maturation protein HypF
VTVEARNIVVTGRVQGVGYRPFVYVTAHELGLVGSVLNGSGKVFIHAEGPAAQLDRLERALVEAAPPLARPRLASSAAAELAGAVAFEILPSDASTEPEIHVPPDLFTCDACLAELTDAAERRHGYPFINCTQCGPRYTIITAMPYDRPNTSMAGFPLCDACRAEYLSPLDRRFHAQPLACPVCGPQLEFVANDAVAGFVGAGLAGDRAQGSLLRAISALEAGQVVAVKGVGGYHLVCDAANDAAVRRLRERKRRPHKPLAVMFPLRGADGLDAVREHLELDEVTAAALADPARPIVLARTARSFGLSAQLAPGLVRTRRLFALQPAAPPVAGRLRAAAGRHLWQHQRGARHHRQRRGAPAIVRHRRRFSAPRPPDRPPGRRSGGAADGWRRAYHPPGPRPGAARIRVAAVAAGVAAAAAGHRRTPEGDRGSGLGPADCGVATYRRAGQPAEQRCFQASNQ